MRELNAILDAWRANRQEPGVLATVVHVEGSAYRRPGARMLISPDGCRRIGTISGGCLEGDVAKKAAWWTASGEPVVRVYDTMSDQDAVWEFGLGCNGVIQVLLERVESPRVQELLEYLDARQRERRACVVGTVVRVAASHSRYRVGDHIFHFEKDLAGPASQTMTERRSCLLHLSEADIFLEYVSPPQRLVIFGAGHDVMPVVSLAAMMGWDVTVADVRSGYAKPERFPGARRVVQLSRDGDASSTEVDRETAVVMMTHNLQLDIQLLPQMRMCRPAYLGILGPRKRMIRLLEEAGMDASSLNVHSPVGLDLGGDSPEAIALSIIAEIQAHLQRRGGGSLRWNAGPIHEPAAEAGAAADLEGPESCRAACEVVYG